MVVVAGGGSECAVAGTHASWIRAPLSRLTNNGLLCQETGDEHTQSRSVQNMSLMFMGLYSTMHS